MVELPGQCYSGVVGQNGGAGACACVKGGDWILISRVRVSFLFYLFGESLGWMLGLILTVTAIRTAVFIGTCRTKIGWRICGEGGADEESAEGE